MIFFNKLKVCYATHNKKVLVTIIIESNKYLLREAKNYFKVTGKSRGIETSM